MLQSETLARRVIDQLHLEPGERVQSAEKRLVPCKPHAASPECRVRGVDPDAEQTVLREFEDRLSVEPVRRSRLVQVSFESQDPKWRRKR